MDPIEIKRKFLKAVRGYSKGGLAEELKKAPKAGALEIVISSSKPAGHDEAGEGASEEQAEGEHSEVGELESLKAEKPSRENGHHLPCQCAECQGESDEDAGGLAALLSK